MEREKGVPVMEIDKPLDELLNDNDYSVMPKYELQQRAIFGDAKAERIYFKRYGKEKVDTVSAKALDPALINIKWIEE
jgi:hypothetical protein